MLTTGCSQPLTEVSLDECPDGQVEVLGVSGDQVLREGGSFLSQVKRTDDVLVLVDFWAGWCQPCLMMNPELESVKKQWGDKLVVLKVDVTENPELAEYFQIGGIPHVRIFRNGEQISGFSGLHSSGQITSILKSLQ